VGSSVDLSNHFSAGLWIKTSLAVADNVIQLILDDDAGCGSPLETLNLTALEANAWSRPHMNVSKPAALTAIACVGLSAASDPGPLTLHADLFEGPAEVQKIHFAMSNTVPTEGITFIVQTDTDGDGLLSDESNQINRMVISYLDKDMIVRNLAWSITEFGRGDGDSVLEAGETFLLTIDLRAVDPIPVAFTQMTLNIAPQDDVPITIEKIVPSKVSKSMILR
jgi:hypothetical protein